MPYNVCDFKHTQTKLSLPKDLSHLYNPITMASKSAQSTQQDEGPYYLFTLDWEYQFDSRKSFEMFNEHPILPFIIAVFGYLSAIYLGQLLMKNREPFKLKTPLLIWNSALAIFSIIGFTRVFPEMVYSLNKYGFIGSVCKPTYHETKPTCLWIYLFVLSKFPELIDTIFLVLKKQKLIFLHVYHHSTVVLFSWFCYANGLAAARWYCLMNFGVHSIMYSYYALKTMPHLIRIPKSVSMLITTLQTLQMVMGAYVVAVSSYAKFIGQDCDATVTLSISGSIIYLSYLVLFSQFFYKAYCAPKPTLDAKSEKKRA